MLAVPDEIRHYLKLDGAPLPLVDHETAQCYMLMPVSFSKTPRGRVVARVPGIRAAGEADQPIEALATLAVVIKKELDRL